MINRKNILILLINFFFITNAFSENIKFEAEKMDIEDNGNTIYAYNSNTFIKSENIIITSNKVKYDKIKDIITFIDNAKLDDKKKELIVIGDHIIYEKNKNLIYSKGKAKFNYRNKYFISSENVFFDRNKNEIYSEDETLIEDFDNNTYNLKEDFIFYLRDEIIKAKKSIILDRNDNKYVFDDIIINLKDNEIVGKELKVEFRDSYFGNDENDPILRGRSAHSDEEKLSVYKAVFSTCNIENKKCRGWELNTDEFNHDKKKKLFVYKNSWLKIFDFKTIFFPYFSHPDPSVKRKSGFLTPTYSSSESLGTSLNFPYYKVLDIDKDLTLSPTFYADKSFLLQNEFRQILKDSSVLSEFGFLVGKDGTKAHLFYNRIGSYNSRFDYELNLQNVKGDNYIKTHNLGENSLLIQNTDVLQSNINLNWNFDDSDLSTSFKIYEDLSRGYNDRYSIIIPDFTFKRNLQIPQDYNGSFNFYSTGYNKFHNTNIRETVLINDFYFTSKDKITKQGLVSNYNLLLKNTNVNSDNSSDLSSNDDYDLFQTLKVDLSIPLVKRMNKYTNYLKPVASFRYSPNGNSDISSNNLILNYNNAFSLDRISNNSQVEGGEALAIGLEFQSQSNYLSDTFFEARIGNVIKTKNNIKLPSKSKLNKTRSDIFGDLKYNFNDNFILGYNFSYDRDLQYSNLDSLNLILRNSKLETTFNYLTENHDFGDSETLSNLTGFNFDKENSISFRTSKNLRDDFTEYYSLFYEYKTDCLSINLDYSKSFYNDGNLEPTDKLSFLLKIIPFTELGVANLGVINN